MEQIFYWTGVVFWFSIGTLFLGFISLALYYWYDRKISPSLRNLRFAIFGKRRNEQATYYKLWTVHPKWFYRYCTRGRGKCHFARLAMKRLVYEARKESQKNKSH